MNKPQTITPRVIVQLIIFIIVVPLLPLLISRRWDWWQAWVYAAINIVGFAASRALAARAHPDLLAERARSLAHEDTAAWDKILAPLVGLGGGLIPLVAGLVMLGQRRLLWLGYGATLAIATLFLIYANDRYGMTGVFVLIALVVVSDTAGYFAGRAFGGPKFWPAISPKKTWSGTLAGWVFTAIFGYFAFPLIGVAPVMGALLSVVLGFSAQMGDIAESAMKRRAGIKDSSNLLPGHGGVLDRLDGLIAAACVAGVLALAAGV